MAAPYGTVCTVSETYANQKCAAYHLTSDGRVQSTSNFRRMWKRFSVKEFFREVFLPQGFPDSVTEDYVEYQIWDTLQAFCSSLTGTLATQAILQGVGVGDANATALAATVTWLLKDGAGMVGRIAFAWAKGTELDCYSKKWRLVADILNDLAIFVDLLAPYSKPLFIPLVCFSSCCRSIVGVAGGATRAALTQHQARRNNLADVSAKDGSQETLVNLSALVCSLILVPLVSGQAIFVWSLFSFFTCLHLFANYRAVKSLRMSTLNETRFEILAHNYLKNGQILGLKETNGLEPLFPGFGWKSKNYCRLKLGCSLAELGPLEIVKLRNESANHFVSFCPSPPTAKVFLNKNARLEDMLLGTFEAENLSYNMAKYGGKPRDIDVDKNRIYSRDDFPKFIAGLAERGWTTSHCLLNFDEYRYSID